jgi:hypothetical protein
MPVSADSVVLESSDAISDNSGATSVPSNSSSSSVPSDSFPLSTVKRRKIVRSLPLHLKTHDPAQCMDIIDEMYDQYFQLQVRRARGSVLIESISKL